jgi:phosphohistidine swiveling domain-containing protein
MKRDQGLFKEKLSTIEKATWYRQRFDACPHFMFFLGDSHISNIQHTKYPYGQRIAYAGFSKNRADWYHGLEELEYTASHIIEASKENPHISKDMIKDFLPWQESFYEECNTLKSKDLSTLINQELLTAYTTLAEIYTNKLNSSPLIDGFALSTDTLIASKIKTFLEGKGLGDKFVEFFAVLTAPTFTSFLQEEEIALCMIAKKVKHNPGEKDTLLDAHQREFFWIRNNYVKDHIEGVEQFKERLQKLKTIDCDSKIQEIRSLAVEHRRDKEALISKLDLPQEIVTLLEITDDFNAWQDERKKGTFWATHYFSILLEEFSKRTKYSIDQLKYVFPPEMQDVLSEKVDSEELNRRIEYCMIVWTLDHYDVTTDIKFIEKLDRIGTGEALVTHEVRGFTASRGKVNGRVKILVSADETGKIEEGDVLVAVMTRPDYLPAMQKAAAFVTDEGGITCHAAIVAREMKKPCIIGTKIATKTFKDGDMVEVDAERGIVRIIN